MRITRRYRFAASHRLHSPQLSDEENQRVYGKCDNPFGHGHNYVLEISARGPVEEKSGRVLAVHRLDALVEREVLREFRHADLNTQIEAFAGGALVPTTENVAREIWRRLSRAWLAEFSSGPVLDTVRLYETRKNIIELTGRR